MHSVSQAPILERLHERGGYFRVQRSGAYVRVECHWPFDSDSGDWIDLTCFVRPEDLWHCSLDMMTGREVRVDGVSGGFLAFEPGPPGFSRVEIADSVNLPPTRLSLLFPGDLQELAARLASAVSPET